MSQFTCHMSHVTWHMSHNTYHMSLVMCQMGCVSCHISVVTCHMTLNFSCLEQLYKSNCWSVYLLLCVCRLVSISRGGGGVSGVYRALFIFELSACYYPNLGIFWGCLALKKNLFQKINPIPVKSLFENTMGNRFYDFLKD